MDNLSAPPGMEIIDYLGEPPSLEWISEDELQYYAEKFQKNGFTGPLNYYRNIDTWVFNFCLVFTFSPINSNVYYTS